MHRARGYYRHDNHHAEPVAALKTVHAPVIAVAAGQAILPTVILSYPTDDVAAGNSPEQSAG